MSDIVLQLLSFVAQNERENIKSRQAAGIAAAKARGVAFGRPPKPLPAGFGRLVRSWESGKIELSKVLAECGNISESTFYRRVREYRCKQGLSR